MQAETTEEEEKVCFRNAEYHEETICQNACFVNIQDGELSRIKKKQEKNFRKARKRISVKSYGKKSFRSNGFSLLMTAISPHSPCFVSFLVALLVVFHARSVSQWCHYGLSKLLTAFANEKLVGDPSGSTDENFRFHTFLAIGEMQVTQIVSHFSTFLDTRFRCFFLLCFPQLPKNIKVRNCYYRSFHICASPFPCTIINNALWMINTFCISIFGIA